MTKILTRQCSLPDLDGNYKDSKVELNIIHAVQFDIETYNYIDVVLRRVKMGSLQSHIKDIENKVNVDKEHQQAEAADEEGDEDQVKTVGVLPIGIGPDGNPLFRNNSDVMNNFWVNFVVRSFTNCEVILAKINQNEKRREKRFAEEVKTQQVIWEKSMIDCWQDAQLKYERMLKHQFVSHDGRKVGDNGSGDQETRAHSREKTKEGTESTGSSGPVMGEKGTTDNLKRNATEKPQNLKMAL